MRDTPLSNCERDFLLKAIEEKKRIDGRQTYDYRRLKIRFGTDYGCCFVDLGQTRVMAQVSCELVAPKDSRKEGSDPTVNHTLVFWERYPTPGGGGTGEAEPEPESESASSKPENSHPEREEPSSGFPEIMLEENREAEDSRAESMEDMTAAATAPMPMTEM
uniref:(Atlantic silverside) hypothetical protein n=1 Tax=Menidia menidia TaxID=238744 RepID=A0A8S4AX58_9TELE|nr:unnamed protein product [Menidia menidia]